MQRAIALLGGTILESNCLNRHPTFHSIVTPAAISQVRTKIEIAAPDGNINRALKRLTDIVQADRLHDAWRRAQVFKRPGVVVQEERMVSWNIA